MKKKLLSVLILVAMGLFFSSAVFSEETFDANSLIGNWNVYFQSSNTWRVEITEISQAANGYVGKAKYAINKNSAKEATVEISSQGIVKINTPDSMWLEFTQVASSKMVGKWFKSGFTNRELPATALKLPPEPEAISSWTGKVLENGMQIKVKVLYLDNETSLIWYWWAGFDGGNSGSCYYAGDASGDQMTFDLAFKGKKMILNLSTDKERLDGVMLNVGEPNNTLKFEKTKE